MAEEKVSTTYRDMLDIIFADRNRAYGAYNLRRSYPKHLTRALIIGALLLVLALSAQLILTVVSNALEKIRPVEVTAELGPPPDINPNDPPPPPPPPPPTPPPPTRSTVKFRINVPVNLGLAALDKDLMRIAVNNLLSNAIKYNRDGGEVVLSAQETEDEHLEIRVRDSGIGISPAQAARVFDKYFRADDPEAGYRVALERALDYRAWHEFQPYLRTPDGGRLRRQPLP